MGFIRPGAPKELVLRLASRLSVQNFVETGTFKGATAFWAAQHFRTVVTIEIRPEISRAAAANPQRPPNIQFLVGNSGGLLPAVVAGLDGPALFWLDGHYSGPGTGDEAAECPIMDELAAIAKATSPIILIDDARCFLGPPPPPHDPRQWPRIDEIFAFLAQHFPGHITSIHDDVIISAPRELAPILDADWLAHFDSRFPQPQPPEAAWFRKIKGWLTR
jgi:hypothetical protein